MIVDPDFLDHWRTGMVADAIKDPMAAIYILRLWGHCQDRKADRFVMPAAGLKAQCRCPADAAVFEQALIDAGFIAREGDTVIVLGWAEKNASLIAAWANGARGGRPPKKNPEETHGKPMGNPRVTQPEPMGNPDETDKRREEKNSPSLRSGEVSGIALRSKPPAPSPPPPFDGENAQALNGKHVVTLAPNFDLPQDWGEDAERLGWKPAEILVQAEKFRQYWTVGKGQGTRRNVKGWRQTWSNWLAKAAEYRR